MVENSNEPADTPEDASSRLEAFMARASRAMAFVRTKWIDWGQPPLRWFWNHCVLRLWNGLFLRLWVVIGGLLSWLFRQSSRGPLFAPAVITQLLVIVAAVVVGFWTYTAAVQNAYVGLYQAYGSANVFQDILSQDATVSLDVDESRIDGDGPRAAILFRSLQLLGLKTIDDTPKSLSSPDDDFHGVYEALVTSELAKDLSLTDSPSALVIAQLARDASIGDTDTATLSNEQIERSATAIACVLANQPGATAELRGLWMGLDPGQEPTPDELQNVLHRMGDHLELNNDANTILWPFSKSFLALLREPSSIDLKPEVSRVLFADEYASDIDILRILFRQMGIVDSEQSGLRNQDETPANNNKKRHFLRLQDFCLVLIAQLHANGDVKKARAWITFVQGPEQFGLLVGFFWMSFLLISRELKRWLVWVQSQLVRLQVVTTLRESGTDDADASLKRRRSTVDKLSEQLRVWDADEDSKLRVAINKLKTSRHEYKNNQTRTWKDHGWYLLSWVLSSVLSMVQFLTRTPPRLRFVTRMNHKLKRHRAAWWNSTESLGRKTALGVPAAISLILTGALHVIQAIYICISWLYRNGPLALFQAGRDAIIRLLEICNNELKQSAPSADVLRHSCRYLRERDRSSRWIIRWIARALPAIGFIGTVRGISAALSQADTIVRAQNAAAQAAAITEVAGTLGIAFTTTLIALLIGLGTSYFDDLQSAQEGDFLRDLEETLVPLLEPSLFTRT